MTTRLSDRTTTDPVVRGIFVVAMAVTVVGVLALVRAATSGRVHHVTVRVDNRAGLAVQVDALDAVGDRVGLGEAKSRTLRTFEEVHVLLQLKGHVEDCLAKGVRLRTSRETSWTDFNPDIALTPPR